MLADERRDGPVKPGLRMGQHADRDALHHPLVAALEAEPLGSACGDYALAQGASAVVLAGGFSQRLLDILPDSGFAERFRFKGRYERMMEGIPIRMLTHPQPGLYGAVAAFIRQHVP